MKALQTMKKSVSELRNSADAAVLLVNYHGKDLCGEDMNTAQQNMTKHREIYQKQ